MDDFNLGDIVLWPNGVQGPVMGVDHSDATLLDHCGAWVAMDDVVALGGEA